MGSSGTTATIEGADAISVRERERTIIRARAAGLTWACIARGIGMSERGCRKAAKRYRERSRQDLLDREAGRDVLHETLAGYEELLWQCATLFYGESHPTIRLGAIRTMTRLLAERIRLLKDLGALPRDLGGFRVERDLLAVAHRIVDVLEEHHVSEEVQRAVLAPARRL
jgi:hypothetical protein